MEDSIVDLFKVPLMCLFNSFFCGFGIFWIIGMIISLLAFILWIFMLIDVIKRDDDEFPHMNKDQKLLWILIVVLTGWIGAIIYYFTVYKKIGTAK